MNIIVPIEAALQKSSAEPKFVEAALIQICKSLTRAKLPAKNFTNKEREALSELREDNTI